MDDCLFVCSQRYRHDTLQSNIFESLCVLLRFLEAQAVWLSFGFRSRCSALCARSDGHRYRSGRAIAIIPHTHDSFGYSCCLSFSPLCAENLLPPCKCTATLSVRWRRRRRKRMECWISMVHCCYNRRHRLCLCHIVKKEQAITSRRTAKQRQLHHFYAVTKWSFNLKASLKTNFRI